MPDLIESIRARNATALEAAQELGRGLMRGNRSDLKLGYTYRNAALAAGDVFAVGRIDRVTLECYLIGFAHGMHGQPQNTEQIIDAKAKLREHSEAFEQAYASGYDRGLGEDDAVSYPAEV